jgi:fused signal recognition particle receptor
MEANGFSNFEIIILALGTLGLLLALWFVVTRSKRGPRPTPLEPPTPAQATEAPKPAAPKANTWWNALAKTRERFFKSSSQEVGALREALEEACIVSDLGVSNTSEALEQVNWNEIAELPESERLERAKNDLAAVIRPWLASSDTTQSAQWPELSSVAETPFVIWFVGVNGVGKTTSIAKLASELKDRGHSVLLAAGDTFRAAAGEQLEIWAERLQIPCVRGQVGADSSSVLFDAIQSAKAKKIDFVLCDSAGRLHNQSQLMEALKKNKRVMEKALPGAPQETLLVLDANTGQNMLNQAENFLSAVQVTGLVLTKLDGSARGGAVVAVARKTQLPIRRLGLGETAKDFVAFDAKRFSSALLGLEAAAPDHGASSESQSARELETLEVH